MKQTELYWLAGILEGEGCFTIRTAKKIYKYPKISLSMTDGDVVRKAATLLGSSVRSSTRGSWKTQYHTEVCGSENVKTWMRRLRPLMGHRRSARITQLLDQFS